MAYKGRVKPQKYKYGPERHLYNENILWQFSANKMDFAVIEGSNVTVEGFGPDILLSFRNGAARTFAIDLTQFNAQELGELKKLFENAFKLAEPISLGRDRKAEELSHDRAMPLQRLTRPISRLLASRRTVGLDGESLLQRPVNISDSDE